MVVVTCDERVVVHMSRLFRSKKQFSVGGGEIGNITMNMACDIMFRSFSFSFTSMERTNERTIGKSGYEA